MAIVYAEQDGKSHKKNKKENAVYKLITHSIVEEHFEQKPYTYHMVQSLGNQGVNQMKHMKQKNEKENEEDVVKFNVPLLIRLLEYAREDSSSDIDLHLVAERIIELSEEGEVLTMEHYSEIVGDENNPGGCGTPVPPPPPPPPASVQNGR